VNGGPVIGKIGGPDALDTMDLGITAKWVASGAPTEKRNEMPLSKNASFLWPGRLE
jgi:hypothetical protein